MDFKLSSHTQDVMKERNICEEWVWQTIDTPEWKDMGEDHNMHYFKSIPGYGGRLLHVVVNPHTVPKKIVTVFFDRRARRQKNEIESRQRK